MEGTATVNADSIVSTEVYAYLAENGFNCSLFKLLANGMVILLICIFGTLGNSLTIVTLWSKCKSNSTSLLLLCLAVADTGVLLTFTLMISIPEFCTYWDTCHSFQNFGFKWLTAYFWPVASSLHLCSTWLTTIVTFHRYVGVCYPHKFQSWTSIQKTRYQLAAIFALSFIYNIPRFCDDGVKLTDDGSEYEYYNTDLGNSKIFGYVYNVGLYYIVIYIVPFTALIHMVIQLIRAFRIAKVKREQMTRAKRDENDLTLTLVIVVIVFMLCQIMNPIRRAVFLAQASLRWSCKAISLFLNFSATLGIMLNSAVNFIIYFVCGKRFRRHLQSTCQCIKRIKIGPDSNSTSFTYDKWLWRWAMYTVHRSRLVLHEMGPCILKLLSILSLDKGLFLNIHSTWVNWLQSSSHFLFSHFSLIFLWSWWLEVQRKEIMQW